MNFWLRAWTTSRWTSCLLVLVGVCVLMWGLNARLRQYRVPTASLAASFMLMNQDEGGGVVVTEGERFRSPLQCEFGSGPGAVLEEGVAQAPVGIRTSEAVRLPSPPTLYELLMRPPPPASS